MGAKSHNIMSQRTSQNNLQPAEGEQGSILVIENDQLVCAALSDILSASGLQVFIAHDGLEGEMMFQAHQEDIDMIILDWMLPKQNGRDTLSKIRKLNPNIQVMISSGYAEADVTSQIDDQQAICFLGKPFNIDKLLNQVAQILA